MWVPISAAAAHADTLDQACTTAAPMAAASITGSTRSATTLAQTFTPSTSPLAAFDILYFNDADQRAHTLAGQLRQGGPTGAVVATASARALAGQVGPMWIRFSFATTPALTPGQVYAFVVSATGSPDSLLWAECADSYSGGNGYSGRRGAYSDLGADLAFRAISARSTPAVSIGDASVLEGDSGTRTLQFAVTLSEPATSTVTVEYTLAGLTAMGGITRAHGADFDDLGGAPQTLTFSAPTVGANIPTLEYVRVKVFSDTRPEPDETMSVTLTSPTGGYQLGRSVGVGTILNDDGAASGTTVGIGDAAVVRGQSGNQKLELPVTLSQRVPAGVALAYTITPLTARFGTAAQGADYGGSTNGVLVFSSGAVVHTITVSVWPDPNPASAPRTFAVTLSEVNNPAVTPVRASGIGTILPAPSAANLPGLVHNVTVQLGSACAATDPITGPQPGTQVIVSWSAPTTGDATTDYVVTLSAAYPSGATATVTLTPIPADQTSSGPQCYPLGAHVETTVAPSNDAGTNETTAPAGGGYLIVSPVNLAWTSPASISDGVPATFASTSPCPTKFADGSPVSGPELVQVTLHTTVGTFQWIAVPHPGWTVTPTPNVGSQDLAATVVAGCYEVKVPSSSSVLIAQYTSNPIAVNP